MKRRQFSEQTRNKILKFIGNDKSLNNIYISRFSEINKEF